mmetsp:Transcript_7224/g.21252  ORF Transcript_7224/g.21252 Transcript_7224/m.21252 type:complete len:227 (-) Transcript_7224:487-1167(-)
MLLRQARPGHGRHHRPRRDRGLCGQGQPLHPGQRAAALLPRGPRPDCPGVHPDHHLRGLQHPSGIPGHERADRLLLGLGDLRPEPGIRCDRRGQHLVLQGLLGGRCPEARIHARGGPGARPRGGLLRQRGLQRDARGRRDAGRFATPHGAPRRHQRLRGASRHGDGRCHGLVPADKHHILKQLNIIHNIHDKQLDGGPHHHGAPGHGHHDHGPGREDHRLHGDDRE